MIILLEKITPVHGGEGVQFSFRISDGEFSEERMLVISAEAYFEQEKLSAGLMISREIYEELEEAAKLYSAISRGMYLLTFGDNNRAQLVSKLMERGHSKAHSERAAESLVKKGYIDEREQLRLLIMRLAGEKLYGRRRILAELYNKRYDRALVHEIYAECEEKIDFEENKRKLLERKYGTRNPRPENRADYEKIKAFLYRYGY